MDMSKVEEEKIWLARPEFTHDEYKQVETVIQENWVSTVGKEIEFFENELIDYLNTSGYISLLNSGTSAIHLALKSAGVKENDIVLCSTFTFVASANPILYLNAIPVFIDSEEKTWNLCPELLHKAILDLVKKGKKPKALVLVHLYGVPSQIDTIRETCREYNITIVEDAAGALGSTYKNQALGTLGDYGVFSFNGNKILTTGSGGALFSHRVQDKKKTETWANQSKQNVAHYEHKEIGYNYKMNNLSAAMGRAQLRTLDNRIKRKREIYNLYKKELNGLVKFVQDLDQNYCNRWLTCILTDSFETREKIRIQLEKVIIESRPLWKPMHMQPVFNGSIQYLNGVSERLFQVGLCLPSDTNMTEEQQNRVIREIKNSI